MAITYRKGYTTMNTNDSSYTQAQKIREQYTPKQPDRLDALKALNRKAVAPARIFAWSFGTVSALLLGSGMSLIMTDISQSLGISQPMIPGLALGISGLVLALANYPVYQRILASRRSKYAQQILSLTQHILQE